MDENEGPGQELADIAEELFRDVTPATGCRPEGPDREQRHRIVVLMGGRNPTSTGGRAISDAVGRAADAGCLDALEEAAGTAEYADLVDAAERAVFTVAMRIGHRGGYDDPCDCVLDYGFAGHRYADAMRSAFADAVIERERLDRAYGPGAYLPATDPTDSPTVRLVSEAVRNLTDSPGGPLSTLDAVLALPEGWNVRTCGYPEKDAEDEANGTRHPGGAKWSWRECAFCPVEDGDWPPKEGHPHDPRCPVPAIEALREKYGKGNRHEG